MLTNAEAGANFSNVESLCSKAKEAVLAESVLFVLIYARAGIAQSNVIRDVLR